MTVLRRVLQPAPALSSFKVNLVALVKTTGYNMAPIRKRAGSHHSGSHQPSKATGNGMFIRYVTHVATVAMLSLSIWHFWDTLLDLVQLWQREPENSHGFVVPLLAAAILWRRRTRGAIIGCPQVSGLLLLAMALAAKSAGDYFYYDSFEHIGFMLAVTAIVWMLAGRQGLRWSWPALLLLLFMFPLPYRLATAMREPLRQIATVGSTYVLQTMGYPAVYEGFVVLIDETRIGVAEVCSGLSMLTVFGALCWAAIFLLDATWWQRLLILLSAVPIALVSNIVRICLTGVAYHHLGQAWGDYVFHTLAGWLMMPAAIVLLALEVLVLRNLIVKELDEPIPVVATK